MTHCVYHGVVSLIQPLLNYLEGVLGARVELALDEQLRLPAYLRRLYGLWRGDVLGESVLFACGRRRDRQQTPKRMVTEARTLQSAAGTVPVVMVLRRVDSSVRRRLIQHRIPFVVPGLQLFLPPLGVDLREHVQRVTHVPEWLGWPTQVTLIRHVLRRDVEGRPLQDVAADLGYSKMTLTNVQQSLVAVGVAELERQGRTRALRFLESPRATWDAAAPRLRSPVWKRWFVDVAGGHGGGLVAGLTALSRLTDIADTGAPTMALSRDAASAAVHEGALTEVEEDECDALVQVWKYDPRVLAESECVDPLSLHLSVRDDPEPRMQQAAERVLGTIEW